MAIRIGDVVADRDAAHERRRHDGDDDEDDEDEELGSLAASSVAVRGVRGVDGAPSSLERHASMACMWHTTVPQSLTPLSECGLQKAKSMRHAPTRRSLRHSRMLVSTKSAGFRRAITSTSIFSGAERVGPSLVIDDDDASLDDVASIGGGGGLTCLVVSQLTVGVTLLSTFAAFAAKNPFWADVQAANLSGALVCLSSCVSVPLALQRRCCVWRSKSDSAHHYHSSYIVLAFLLSLIASLCCLFSFAVLTFHLYRLFVAIPHCKSDPPKDLRIVQAPTSVTSCQCGDDLVYPGLECGEVRSLLPPSLTATSALNFAGFFLGVWLTAAATVAAQRQKRARIADAAVDDRRRRQRRWQGEQGGGRRRRLSA